MCFAARRDSNWPVSVEAKGHTMWMMSDSLDAQGRAREQGSKSAYSLSAPDLSSGFSLSSSSLFLCSGHLLDFAIPGLIH